MIKQKLKRIIDSGLDCNMLAIMHIIAFGEDPSDISSKCAGWQLLLEKRGIIGANKQLTAQGAQMLSDIETGNDNVQEKTAPVIEAKNSFNSYCTQLFEKIKERITELTGKDQWKNPSKDYLRPSSVKELQEQLTKFINKYNYKDLEAIEREILRHVEYAIKINNNGIKDKYVRSVFYFIMKKDIPSELLKKLSNEIKEEDKSNIVSEDNFVNI